MSNQCGDHFTHTFCQTSHAMHTHVDTTHNVIPMERLFTSYDRVFVFLINYVYLDKKYIIFTCLHGREKFC